MHTHIQIAGGERQLFINKNIHIQTQKLTHNFTIRCINELLNLSFVYLCVCVYDRVCACVYVFINKKVPLSSVWYV